MFWIISCRSNSPPSFLYMLWLLSIYISTYTQCICNCHHFLLLFWPNLTSSIQTTTSITITQHFLPGTCHYFHCIIETFSSLFLKLLIQSHSHLHHKILNIPESINKGSFEDCYISFTHIYLNKVTISDSPFSVHYIIPLILLNHRLWMLWKNMMKESQQHTTTGA